MRIAYDNQIMDAVLSAATAHGNYPVSNLKDRRLSKVYKSTSGAQQWIKVAGTAIPASCLMLAAHDIVYGATITLQGNDTDVWTAPAFSQTVTWDEHIMALFFTKATYNYWRLYVDSYRTVIAIGGETWTAHPAAEDNAWQSVAYGGGLFVAVESDGRVMTSPDGITWTGRAGADGWWQSVAYGGGLFVAVSYLGIDRVMTSPDGITWTAGNASASYYWQSVTYGDGLFVAVGRSAVSARVMTSPDGTTWTVVSTVTGVWQSVTYGDGLFVAVGDDGANRVMTSPDGTTWTAVPAPASSWQSVTYGDGLFVAVADSGTDRLITSPDGITWTASSVPAVAWQSVAYGDGLFVAVAADGTDRIMISPDGLDWTALAAPVDSYWRGVCYGGGLFVAVASSGTPRTMVAPSTDVWGDANDTFTIGGLYLGEYIICPYLDLGYSMDDNDASIVSISSSGQAYGDERYQYRTGKFSIPELTHTQRAEMREFYEGVGRHTPYYLTKWADHLDKEAILYCITTKDLSWKQDKNDPNKYSMTLEVQEVF